MFFEQEFIEWVEENPVEGLVRACELTLEKQKLLDNPHEWTEPEHELLWEASSFIEIILKENNIDVGMQLPEPETNTGLNCQHLMQYLQTVTDSLKEHATKLKIESYKSRYNSALKNSFAYEFSQGDLDRIQALINELRTHIDENHTLEESHKLRLLKRLEKLQLELHKRVSDLDRFWGLVGDAGVVLGKLGNDAKPIVDRVKEIAEITWKTQARAEELPSGSQNPMLEQNDSE
jgi:hypothetical protein